MMNEPVTKILKILIVEDNPDHAHLAKNAIQKSKHSTYEIELCSSVDEAVEKLSNGEFRMVISDFHLGDKTGLDLLQWLNEKDNDIPFVMVTGEGDEKTAVKAMQDGAYNYLVKDDVYLKILPRIVDDTFIRYLAVREKERLERELREKNAALEKANRDLKKLDEIKSDFLASVSHDLRSPLNSIQESAALLLEGIVDSKDEKGKQVLQIAMRGIERLNKMIADLLDFAKIESGEFRLRMVPADIQVLIDEAYFILKPLADKRNVVFKFKHKKDFPKVDCDAGRIVQVFSNLIGNAIKFMPQGGVIRVENEIAGGGRVKVTVSDTGPGIAPEDLTRIFDRFVQVKGMDSGGIKGTGMGLAICKEVVKLHGGDIWAESSVGRGSHFVILMPIHQAKKFVPVQSRKEGGIE